MLRKILLQNFTGWKISHNVIYKCRKSVFRFDRFYSVDRSIKELNRYDLGSSSFVEIANSPNFVDKTLFIESFLKCRAKYLLITAPRRFGKSVNLDMLRVFFDSKQYKELFSKMNVGRTSSMDLCGSMPVVWLNMKHGVGSITSIEDTVNACRFSIREAFLNNKYLITSKKLDDPDKELCELWCNRVGFKSLDKYDVEHGLLDLTNFVSKHYERKCLFLVDEYDAICSSAFSRVDSSTLIDIVDFYSGIIGSVIKTDTKFVERAVITGITRIMSAGLSNPINNVVAYPFSEEQYFSDFYGITEDEFTELMNRDCNSSIRHLQNEALRYYNGYVWAEKRILNTWSVMNFLNNKEVKPYWVQSGIVQLCPENTCKNEMIRNCVVQLVKDDIIDINNDIFNAKSFKSFFEDFCEPENKTIINYSPLLNFYFQQGYLTRIDSSFNTLSLKIPNEEVRAVFLKSLDQIF